MKINRGFTLVELLTTIAIIGLLVGLLVPAVQSAREGSRRTQCASNQKQLAAAMTLYLEQFGRLPAAQLCLIDAELAGGDWRRWTWFAAILPFVDQQSLATTYAAHYYEGKPGGGSFSYVNLPNKTMVVPGFMCPSDGANPKVSNGSSSANQQGFHGNYVLNAGTSFFNPGGNANSAVLDGLFFARSAVTAGHIRDGLANTLLSSELILVPDGPINSGQEDVRGRYHNGAHAGALFSTLYPPNTSQPDVFRYCLNNKVVRAPCQSIGTNVVVSARSYHSGGVIASMADGSVRFVTEVIDPTVFRAAGSRDGKEMVSDW